MATLPFAQVGGIWLLYLLSYNLSVAGAVGFIALGHFKPQPDTTSALRNGIRLRRGASSVKARVHQARTPCHALFSTALRRIHHRFLTLVGPPPRLSHCSRTQS